MAHFAQLDENNIVQRIIVVSNDDIVDDNGIEQEGLGIAVCQAITGGGTWVQTSYNGSFRKKYASIGDKYEASADLFYGPVSPYPSWTLYDNYDWQPPTPMPDDGKPYRWHEDSLIWVEVPVEEPEP